MGTGIIRLVIATAATLSDSFVATQATPAIGSKSRYARTIAAAALATLVASLAACGGDSDGGTASAPTSTQPTTPTGVSTQGDDQAPTISGTPQTQVNVGKAYKFQPKAGGRKNASLAFRAQNQPAWLTLDTATGVLSGNPQSSNIGVYKNIVLSVTDGAVVASLPAFNVEVVALTSGPYFGTPIEIPGTIHAVEFDRGGEGIGYHDLTRANDGGVLRPTEGVDIRLSQNASNGQSVVDNFETGEWLAYTTDVTTAGRYDVWLRVSSVFRDSAFHVEVGGHDVTGQIPVPNTSSADTFQWVKGTTLNLGTGKQVLKVVADRQYFDLDSITIVAPAVVTTSSPPTGPAPLVRSVVNFSCSFTSALGCGLTEQAKLPGRASLTNIARDGATGLRLHTEPGDNDVANSYQMQRNDVYISQDATDGYEGHEAWWAHSMYFPDDFTVPTWQSYVVFDFHNTAAGGGQANFHVIFQAQGDILKQGLLSFMGFGGANTLDGRYDAVIGEVKKNAWYDFVYHVRWSSGADGFFDAWVNGKRVLAHKGPTMYAGQGVYLKLANYHTPLCDPYPACIGKDPPSSVIHDRVIRGTTAQAVSSGPLDGYLDLVNGVLTPRF